MMMTTMAALLGAVPLAIGFSDGSEFRRPLGISIVGGLILSQLLTLYTTPVVYIYLDRFRLWCQRMEPQARPDSTDRMKPTRGVCICACAWRRSRCSALARWAPNMSVRALRRRPLTRKPASGRLRSLATMSIAASGGKFW